MSQGDTGNSLQVEHGAILDRTQPGAPPLPFPFEASKICSQASSSMETFLVYEMMLSLQSLHFLHLSRLGAPQLLCTSAFRCSTAQSK